MDREQRISIHKKQERTSVKNGKPKKEEVKEGIIDVRYFDGILHLIAKKDNQLWKFKGEKL